MNQMVEMLQAVKYDWMFEFHPGDVDHVEQGESREGNIETIEVSSQCFTWLQLQSPNFVLHRNVSYLPTPDIENGDSPPHYTNYTILNMKNVDKTLNYWRGISNGASAANNIFHLL